MQIDTPAGEVRGPEAQYFSNLDQGRFLIQQCGACSRHVFFPRVVCPHCGSSHLEWVEPSGKGTVYSTSVIYGKPGTNTDRNIVLVDLDEGVRMMSRVEGIAPDKVTIGMRVRSRVQVTEGKGLVVFEAEEAA